MTLPFSQTWPSRMGELAGQPNYFTNKIMKSMWLNYPDETRKLVIGRTTKQARRFMEIQPFEDLTVGESQLLPPKLHTIREDKSNRWKAGNDIHFVINNRTKNRLQFAPIIKCKGTQYISIIYIDDYPIVYLGDTQESCMPFYWENPYDSEDGYGVEQMKELAMNDGFNSIEDFFKYFDSDFIGKIIHWTDLKY